MKIDYKIVSIVLLVLLVVSVAWKAGPNYNQNMPMNISGTHVMPDGMMMGGGISEMRGGHMMPDGTVMGGPMSDDMMESMMMDMTGRLVGKTGDELDRVFLEDMIVHHQGAVDMSNELLKRTTRPEMIKFANDIISAQTQEIEMQKMWLKDWFGVVK